MRRHWVNCGRRRLLGPGWDRGRQAVALSRRRAPPLTPWPQLGPPNSVKSDHWFHDLFRAMPDLVRHLLPELTAEVELPGESAYTFRPL
ncbi:MAG: hypothetical protein RLZZ117_520, partial [Cyanobacteriota bacterium]